MIHLSLRLTVSLAAALTPQTVQEAPGGAAPQREAPAQPVTGPLALFSWTDFDADGLLDAFVIQPDGGGHLLHNRGDGSFEEQTERRGLLEAALLSDAAWADYDGDGLVDLLWASPAGALQLWKQSQEGTFVDETHLAGLAHVEGGIEVEWRDLNADGLADLRVSTAASDRVFQNTIGGSFVEVDLSLDPRAPFAGGAWLIADPRESERVRPDPGAVTRRAGELLATRAGSPAGIGDRTADDDSQALTAGGILGGGPASSLPPTPGCSGGIDDLAAPGLCIQASSIPSLGALYPMSSMLNVDPATGWVGINKIDPDTRLHVVGQGRFVGGSDVSTSPGTGMLQVVAPSFTTGLGIDANEIQTWGAELHINEDNQFGTSINSTVFVTTSGLVGLGTATPGYALEVAGQSISGTGSSAPGLWSAIGGGANNTASGDYSTIGGGGHGSFTPFGNTASGTYSTIGGGLANQSVGWGSTVPGGYYNKANGQYSFAAGSSAVADHDGAFVWCDSATGAFTSTADDQFLIQATGGVGIGTNSPASALDVAGTINTSALDVAGTINASGLDVAGTINTEGFQMATGAQAGHVLTSNASGSAAWQALAADGDWVVSGNDMYSGVSGNLGIGTSMPGHPLEIRGGDWPDGPPVYIKHGNTEGSIILDTSCTCDVGIDMRSHSPSGGGPPKRFIVGVKGNVDLFRIYSQRQDSNLFTINDVSGNVGIRTDNPGHELQVAGTMEADDLLVSGNVGIGTTTPAFKLEVNGSAGKPGGGSWSVASDARLKKDVEDVDGALETLLALRGVTFEYIDPAAVNELDGRRIGFIAQEVEQVLPDWVSEKDDGTKYLSIRGFEALAVEALRELSEAKDAGIAKLQAENESLRERLERVERALERIDALER